MMKIVNQISKSIKSIPKDKVVSSYFVKGDGTTFHNFAVNGIVYIDRKDSDSEYSKTFEVYHVEDVEEITFYNRVIYYMYTRDGIDGYYKDAYRFEFNKYINNTGALPYESIYYIY